MQVIGNEKLMSSAKMVGRSLQSSFQKLMDKYEEKLNVPPLFLTNILRHECLGDIRGSGLIWAIEIVNNKRENKPVNWISSFVTFVLCLLFRNQSWPQKSCIG